MGFSGRCILIESPTQVVAESRLKESGETDERVQEILKAASESAEQSLTKGFYEEVVGGDDLDSTYKSFESFIFSSDDENRTNGAAVAEDQEVAMADATPNGTTETT